jgi:hypothetical protein
MPQKRLNAVERTAGEILGGYMRSKLDANTLQPAIFSDLYGKKLRNEYEKKEKRTIVPKKTADEVLKDLAGTRMDPKNQFGKYNIKKLPFFNKKYLENASDTIKGAIRGKIARRKMAEAKEGAVLKTFKKPVADLSDITEVAETDIYDAMSNDELRELKKSLPKGGYKKDWTREQKDIFNAVKRRQYKLNKPL